MRTTSAADAERGLTLIELVIGMGIAAIVSVLSMYVLISTFKTQATVTANAKAATQGQLVSEIIDKAIRTASAVGPAGDRLDVQVSTGGCQAFAVVDGDLHETASAAPITSGPSTWPVIAVAVSPIAGADGTPTPYFGAPPSAASGTGATYSFTLQSGNGAVDIVSSAFARAPRGSISPCA